MNKTPLFATHQLRGAEFEPTDGWMMPASFAGVQAEVDAVRSGCGIVDLANLGTVELEGPDARRFCNGMFTNNIQRLQAGQGNRNAMCDDRGRLQGLLDLYCDGDEQFFGVLEGATAAWFEERYKMFIVFDDVELTASDEAPWVLSLQGPTATSILEGLKLPLPNEPDHAHTVVDALRVTRRDRTGLGGFDLVVPTEALDTVYAAAVQLGAVPVGTEAMDALRIVAGRARWPSDGTERSMVHELRLNEDVCAFDKGCYVGQEIINRIDVRGQITKKLMGLVLAEDALPPTGAEVVHDDKVLGTITSAVRVDGRVVALSVLRKAGWEPDTAVQIKAGDRTVDAKVSELPFTA